LRFTTLLSIFQGDTGTGFPVPALKTLDRGFNREDDEQEE